MTHTDRATDSSGRVAEPSVVLVSGAPGSGKSTVGALVARRLSAALLDLDTATTSLTAVVGDLLGTDDLDDPELARVTRGARYETLAALAEDSVSVGTSVVLVAPFTTERRDPGAWEILRERMSAAGAGTTLVWLRISPDEVLRRVVQRGAGRDAAKLGGSWLSGLDLDPPSVPHLEVDAHLASTEIAEIVVASLLVGARQ